MINIKNFDSSLLKTDIQKNCYLLHWIYHKKDKYAINRVNPLYLIVHEEKEGHKYLNFAFTDSNSEVLKNMQKFRVKLKIKLKQ